MPTAKTKSSIGVKQLPTEKLIPNPHNPRVLFDKAPMEKLRESIKRTGILVPLTVYLDKDRYVILDGQRRWMCAKEVGLKNVPANEVAPPTLVQNIVTMFQIHKLREDWELMPTALKVELLMNEIGDRNDGRVAALTGLDEAVIARCKKLISFEPEFQDMMLEPDPDRRLKADFFIELYAVINDRDVKAFEWFKRKQFIKSMLRKYLEPPHTIKSVTDFRVIKQHVTQARRIGALKKFSQLLREFAAQRDLPISHLEIEEASVHAEAKALVKRLETVEMAVTNLDIEQFYGEETLWTSMERLRALLDSTLRAANKRR